MERGRGAMSARGHGGAEMAKVGCRVDARADRGACENEKIEGKGREMASDAYCAWMVCMIAVW